MGFKFKKRKHITREPFDADIPASDMIQPRSGQNIFENSLGRAMAREDMKMMSELYDREAEEDSAHPCPKCQENQILEGDYVCEKCRFG